MDQKKYRNVGKNFKNSLIIGVGLTVGAMTFVPSEAHAQDILRDAGKTLETEVSRTINEGISGIFEGMRHAGKERRTTRDTEITAEESARREAIINGSGGGTMGQGGMISQRSMTVTSQNEDGTVRSTVQSNNHTSAQIQGQEMWDDYYERRQIRQAYTQRDVQQIHTGQNDATNEQLALLQAQIQLLQAQNEALRLQQQQQQHNGGSAYYQPTNGGSTTTTLSERDQQMKQNCERMKNNGATVLPDKCNNLLQSVFRIQPRPATGN